MSDLLRQADVELGRGEYQHALSYYKALLDSEPDNAFALEGTARCLERVGRLDEAIQVCNQALHLNPALSITHSVLGSIFLRQRHYAEAEPELRRAIELNPRRINPYLNLGNTLIQLGRLREAEVVLLEALQLGEDSPTTALDWIYLLLARIHSQQEQYAQAFKESVTAFRLHPSVTAVRGMTGALMRGHIVLSGVLFVGLMLLSLAVVSPVTIAFTILVGMILLVFALDTYKSDRRGSAAQLVLIIVLIVIYTLRYLALI